MEPDEAPTTMYTADAVLALSEEVRRDLRASEAERREAHDREIKRAMDALRLSLETRATASATDSPSVGAGG